MLRANYCLFRASLVRRGAHHCNNKLGKPTPSLTVPAIACGRIKSAAYSSDVSIAATPFEKGLPGIIHIASPCTVLPVTASSRALTASKVEKAVSLATSVITEPLADMLV